MKVLQVRNVNEALPRAVQLLLAHGVPRGSRYGDVIQAPFSVTTVYEKPCERVLFSPERDANPFFHFYEMLWMVAGRNDVAGVARYAKRMATFSDNGQTFHGAYGHRWLYAFGEDQLEVIIQALQKDPTDRRCVLQMWDTRLDLGQKGKDFPCNTLATFQMDHNGALHMVVFCRSNDIVWGAYGANAVHFAFLLEYMARFIGASVGTYAQVSVNWHAYVDVFKTVAELRPDRMNHVYDPYTDGGVLPTLLPEEPAETQEVIEELLRQADNDFDVPPGGSFLGSTFRRMTARRAVSSTFWAVGNALLRSHQAYRVLDAPHRYDSALALLGNDADPLARHDWIIAAKAWLVRRRAKWSATA